MKKIYMKPTVTVDNLMMENVIASSVTSVGGTAGITLGDGDAPGVADAKGRGNADDFGDLW